MTLLLAAVAGLLSAAAFAPLSVPFAMVAGVALLVGLLRHRARSATAGGRPFGWRPTLVGGLVFGLTFIAPLTWWMRAVSDGAYVGLALSQTVFLALVVLLLRAVVALPGWPVWVAGTWVAGEWLRGSYPFTGFPWGRLVTTSLDTPLAPWVRLLGMPGTSALMVLLACALVVVVEHRRVDRTVALATGAVVATLLVGTVLPVGAPATGGSTRVALVQGNTPGEFLRWPRGEILVLHAEETARLADRVEAGESPRPDLVLWPENATDVDPGSNAGVAAELRTLSRRLDAPILVGGIFDGPTTTTSYNAGELWDADGPGQRYVKRNPVPWGEYVPFRDLLGPVVPQFDRDIPRDMLAGTEPGVLRAAGVTFADTICWDVASDAVVREATRPDTAFIVVQTSNAAFTGTAQPEQQFEISRLRALELGRPVLIPSTNGISAVIDASGQVVERAPVRTPATIETTVQDSVGTTPARRTERPIEVVWVLAGLVGLVWAALRRRRPVG